MTARASAAFVSHGSPMIAIEKDPWGAALPGERVTTIYEGFRYGTISMRSFALET